jgi:MoxR-like ATPase
MTQITINAQEAVKHLTMCFQLKLTPMLSGHPGIGKSSIYAQIAKRFKLKLIDVRLSQYDTTDLN